MANAQIFLSAVSAEFRSYRDVLRRDLDGPNVTAKVQEDFIATGTETLDKLDEYIRHCNAVIHLVGDMIGSLAQPRSVAVLRQRYPDFAERFPVLAPFLEPNGPALSYTQWEAWLALYHGKVLIIAEPLDVAPRDKRYQLDDAQRTAQQAHLTRLASVERYAEIHFENADRLAVLVLRSMKLKEILTLRRRSPEFRESLKAHTRKVADKLAADVPASVSFETVISADGSVSGPFSAIQGDAEDTTSLSGQLPYLERTLKYTRDATKTTVLEIFDRWKERDGPGSTGPVVVMGAGAMGKTTELCRLVRHISAVISNAQDETMPICYLALPQGSVDVRDGDASSLAVEAMMHQALRLPREFELEKVRVLLKDLPPAIFLVDLSQALATRETLFAVFGALREFYYDTAECHLMLVTYRTSGNDPVVDKLTTYQDRKWRSFHPYMIQPAEAAQIECVMSRVACFPNLSQKERNDYVELLSNDLLMLEQCRKTSDEVSLRSRGACFYTATLQWKERCEKLDLPRSVVLDLAATVCRTDGDLSIDPDDELIHQCLGMDDSEGSKQMLDRLASANIIRRRGDYRYEFIHADYAYFCAALWIRCTDWVTLRPKEDYELQLSEAVKRVTITSHVFEIIRFLPGVLERLERLDDLAQLAKDGESDLYRWLRSRFVKWPESNTDLTSVRLNLLQVAEIYLDMQSTGEKHEQLVGLCMDALSLRDPETRYRAIEQLLNIFFRQAMAVVRQGEVKAIGVAGVVEELTRAVAADLRAGKGWSEFRRLAPPWALQRYGPRVIQPLMTPFYPESLARIDSALVLLLVLAGQEFSIRAPIGAEEKEIEKVRKAREAVVEFVVRQCFTLLESMSSSARKARRAESPLVKLVAFMIYTHYRFNARPCNFYQMKRVLFSGATGNGRDTPGGRTWLVRIADLFVGSGVRFQKEKDWLIGLCDETQNGLVAWYTYTILSIHGNRLETSSTVIELLDELAKDTQPNGVRRYVAFHALRSLIFYSDVIRADRYLYKKAAEAFERIAEGALLEMTIEPSASRTLTLGVIGGSKWEGRFVRWAKSLIRGVAPPYDNEFLLYYAQFLFQTEVSRGEVVDKLANLAVSYLNRCRGNDQIQGFEYVVDTMARVGIAENYTEDALEVLNALQTKLPNLKHDKRAIHAMQQAFDKVGGYQPREAERQRREGTWGLNAGRKTRDRAVAAEIYEPQSFYGDAVYQNFLFNEEAQKSFAKATKAAAEAESMFDFFFAYAKSVSTSIADRKKPVHP